MARVQRELQDDRAQATAPRASSARWRWRGRTAASRCSKARRAGAIVWPPRGDKGFGYDPMFQPDGHARTFGEMSHEEKLPLTHRARAFEKLVAALG